MWPIAFRGQLRAQRRVAARPHRREVHKASKEVAIALAPEAELLDHLIEDGSHILFIVRLEDKDDTAFLSEDAIKELLPNEGERAKTRSSSSCRCVGGRSRCCPCCGGVRYRFCRCAL